MSYLDSPRAPGLPSLMLAGVFPAVVILIELLSGICANAFFDPLPTLGHLLLVSAVPLTNCFLWRAAQEERASTLWLIGAGGAAIAVSATYTLLLLPALPIALIGVIIGIGLLPFAPVLTLVFGIRWTRSFIARRGEGGKALAGGVGVGLLLLVLIDLPATATHLALTRYAGGADRQQQDAVALVRTLGDREILLRLSYGDTIRATGLVSALVSLWGDGLFADGDGSSHAARELYYRVSGHAFNAMPPPAYGLGARKWLFAFDEDEGGERVGGRVAGLSLASSRLDGSVASADNVGYFEWTLEIANADQIQHEARFTIAMPEGAVASRATLWVNGQPREASVAGRGAARAAYSRVVNARRDPLLVTTDGAQRLLVQAFPIAAAGAVKLRIGLTAPFAIGTDGRRSLALPAIVERNFEVDPDLRHAIWVEGDGPIASPHRTLARDATGVLRGDLPDRTLTARRPRIAATGVSAPALRIGRVAAAAGAPAISVAQRIAPAPVARASAVMIVVDGSAGNREAGRALADAVDALPPGVPVGLTIAGRESRGVDPAPWSPVQRERLSRALAGATFEGGEDNLPALVGALEALPGPSGRILWIHGPQPVAFPRSAARLEQVLERRPALPQLIRYQAEPGRAFTAPTRGWFDGASEIIPSGDPGGDLRRALARASGGSVEWAVTRESVEAAGAPGSAHLVRLWAAERIRASLAGPEPARAAQIPLARRLNLVTPVSGAVVLETDKDYADNDLPVPGAEDVPTVPEPGTWALLAMLALLSLWLYRRRAAGAFA